MGLSNVFEKPDTISFNHNSRTSNNITVTVINYINFFLRDMREPFFRALLEVLTNQKPSLHNAKMEEDDDGSVVSLEDSVRAISIFADITPVKKKHEHLDKRLTKIEKKLDKLRISKEKNVDIEKEWSRCRAEIFQDADSRSPKTKLKIEREVQKRQEFLQRLCSPKRQRGKTITDGIAKTYHAEVEHQAKEKPG